MDDPEKCYAFGAQELARAFNEYGDWRFNDGLSQALDPRL